MKNNKNLNPLNDPEVAEMLTMSPDDQLWSFLDDCVPYDGKDAVLVILPSSFLMLTTKMKTAILLLTACRTVQ